MEAFHPPKEVKKTIDDSALPKEEGISEKWLREKIDSLIPLIQEKWPNIAPVSYTHLTLPTNREV